MTSWRCGLLFGATLAATLFAARASLAEKPADQPPLMPPAGQKGDDAPPADPGKQVVLPYAKYKELLDEIARLKAKVKPLPPAKCQLKGRVENGVVFFTGQFFFHAERADSVFALACGQAKALGAQQQDGRTPLLSSDQDGFQVQVEKPGDYQVSLDLSLPLSQRPGGHGLELDLPRAVVTTLEMDLPPDARAPRLGGKELTETSLTLKNGHIDGPLGPVDKLDLSWQGAPPPPGVGPIQTARGRVKVRAEDGWVTTEADLQLRAQGGPAGQWVLFTPAGAEVKPSPADQQRVQSVNRADEAGGARHTILLKEPSDEDLTVTVTARAPLTAGKRAAVGPFLVRGVVRQSGVVLVSAPGQDGGLLFHAQPELSPRDLTDDERRADPALTAAFEYSSAAGNLPWLEVEAGAARGVLKTRVDYTLALGRAGTAGALEWQVTAVVAASPLFGAGPDHLDIQLPADCEFLHSPLSDDVLSVDPDKEAHVVHVQLARKPTGSVAVTIRARCTGPPVGAVGEAVALPLPRPLAPARDGGGRVDITAPDEVELLPAAGEEPAVKEAHKLAWPLAELPERVAVSWRPYRPETHASSVYDVTLHGQTAEVRQELRLRFPRAAPDRVVLRTPAAVAGLELLEGGRLLDEAPAPGTRAARPSGNEREQVLKLHYSFAAPGDAFTVPLVSADQATEGDTRVRVWSDPGRLPLPPDGGDWGARDVELVPGADRLPVLVLRRLRPDAPLTLRLDDAPGTAAAVLVDRVLCRASRSDGAWEIRASYLIRQIADPTLDVELPAAPSALGLRVALDGSRVDWQAVVEGNPVRHVARLRLGADLVRGPAVLDLAYELKPGQTERAAARETLRPPLLAGDPRQAPARWEVFLPAGEVALAPDDGGASRRTAVMRGWLLAPQLAVTGGELERWFAGADVAPRTDGAAAVPSLVCWQDAGEPLVVAFVPQWAWLLACSLPLLLLGVFLFSLARQAYAGRRRTAFWFWLTVVLLIPAAGALWVFRPTLLYAVAYGCEPGAAVLLLALAFQWVLLERYRRQIVFLPSFRRARTGSSLVRDEGSRRPAGEPSTVDAPRTAGSSQKSA